jgi:hypothetical protein
MLEEPCAPLRRTDVRLSRASSHALIYPTFLRPAQPPRINRLFGERVEARGRSDTIRHYLSELGLVFPSIGDIT